MWEWIILFEMNITFCMTVFTYLFLMFFSFWFVFVSIAIGREGGVAPLIALARSDAEVSVLSIDILMKSSYFSSLLGLTIVSGSVFLHTT